MRIKNFSPWVLVLALSAASVAQAEHDSDCPVSGCDLLADGAYAGVLIGRLDTLLNDEQSHQLLRAAHAQGRWADLPADGQQFTQRIQAAALRVPAGTSELRVIALMSVEESQAMPLEAGDLVRFRPHPSLSTTSGHAAMTRPSGGIDLAYWNAIGCIAILCRASDKDCQGRYTQGAWRPGNGQPIDPLSTTPLVNGQRIDPMTYLPEAAGSTP